MAQVVTLNPDIFLLLIHEVLSFQGIDKHSSLLSLSTSCRFLRDACLPFIFCEVHWPHSRKHDEQSGLLFFPKTLWAHFRRFCLRWPDDWPDAVPPRWGEISPYTGDYSPHHIDQLVSAIPCMSSLLDFSINCPFVPPLSILSALAQCPSLTSLTVEDTPLDLYAVLTVPLPVSRISLATVGQALRVGDGPHNVKYLDLGYYWREWKKRYRAQLNFRRPAEIRVSCLFLTLHSGSLRHLELSGELCSYSALAAQEWPNLHTFVLTGHAPSIIGTVDFVDVIAHMKQLRDLRLLFAQTKAEEFRILPALDDSSAKIASPFPATLDSLALSNACKLSGVLDHATSLRRLAILAIIDLPRVPIGLSHAKVRQVLEDMSLSGARLKHLRIVIEDKLNPVLCRYVADYCPKLEVLEIELCGYHDGKSIFAWNEFVEAFAALNRLRFLRLCVQFPEYDESPSEGVGLEPWRVIRRYCGYYLASRICTLERVGFEYRKRTGTHRYEDSWLEFDVARMKEEIELCELQSSFYRFPEVWETTVVSET